MIVTFFGVATTFCTVAWRGMITTRQAEISHKQIVVTEENNLASIMQKGAEFIADDDSPSKISAGISSLHTVLISGNKNYSIVAHSLLVALVREHGRQCHNGRIEKQAINALNTSFREVGFISDEILIFTEDVELVMSVDDYFTNWIVIYGVSNVQYRGGNIKNQNIKYEKGCEIIFKYVQFEDCIFENLRNIAFDKCTFIRCSIGKLCTSDFKNSLFLKCDFSDAEIVFNGSMSDMRAGENYYYEQMPPRPVGNTGKQVVWSDMFLNPPFWGDMNEA